MAVRQRKGSSKGTPQPREDLTPSQSTTGEPVTPLSSISSVGSSSKQGIVVNEKERKKQAFWVRTVWTFVMLAFFFFVLGMGPTWLIPLILCVQIIVFKELISITTNKARNEDLRYTTYIDWYFVVTTIFYLEGRSIIKYSLKYVIDSEYTSAIAIKIAMHHKFLCYLLYVLGFVAFVATLKKGYLKYQLAQLCITHMIILFVVFQGNCVVNNIVHGLFWFLLPCGLVITNDIFAYVCGITFGRTQLISISPKKTVEGFVGAWICTTLMSILLTYIFCNRVYFTCPLANDLSASCLSEVQCDLNPVFVPQVYQLPPYLMQVFDQSYIQLKPIYIHSIILSMFASLIAPFGGFFGSGLKRAFKVKDFGDTIPGHGGITDRMDCQFLMGSFSYLYYETFISVDQVSVGNLLQTIVIHLSNDDILQLVRSLNTYLFKSGVIDQDVYSELVKLV